MVDKKERPGLAEIRNWQNDRITQFLLKSLIHKFPSYRDLLPVKSQEQQAVLNYRAGSQSVLEAIAGFCENGEV